MLVQGGGALARSKLPRPHLAAADVSEPAASPPPPPPPLPRQALAARLRGFNGTELGHLAELGAALQAAAATEAADRAAMERRIDAEVAGLDYSLGNATLKQREQLSAKVWRLGSSCTCTHSSVIDVHMAILYGMCFPCHVHLQIGLCRV